MARMIGPLKETVFMDVLTALVLFYGSRGNRWSDPPKALIDLLTEWLMAAGVQTPHQFWIEAVEPIEKPTSDRIVTARMGKTTFLEIRVFLEREGGGDMWTLHMNWSPGVTLGVYNSLIDATEFFRLDPTQADCPVYGRMVAVYEMVNGNDFTSAVITDVVATDAFFRDANDLLSGLRFLAKRGFFVSCEEVSNEFAFCWMSAFREHMDSITEERCERLLHLDPIDPAELARRLDDFQGEMLEALGSLKPGMFDAGQQIRVPNKFLGLTSVALEHFIGLLAAARVVVAVSDHELGILGKIWRVDMNKRQQVLDLYHASRTVSQPPPQPEPPTPLPRDREIERDLNGCRMINQVTAERIAENEQDLASVRAELFELEGRLAALRANEASLESTLADDRGGYEATCRTIESLDLELAALAAVLDDKAVQLVADIKRQAVEMNLDPDKLLTAVRAALVGQRPS